MFKSKLKIDIYLKSGLVIHEEMKIIGNGRINRIGCANDVKRKILNTIESDYKMIKFDDGNTTILISDISAIKFNLIPSFISN